MQPAICPAGYVGIITIQPCDTFVTATTRLLLARAAEHAALTPAEREACRNLADDLDGERPEHTMMRPRLAVSPGSAADRSRQRRGAGGRVAPRPSERGHYMKPTFTSAQPAPRKPHA